MRRLTLLLALSLTPSIASAQAEIGVMGGFFSPTNDFTTTSNLPGFGGQAQAKHQTAVAFGAMGRFWFDEKFGIEATVLHSPGNVGVGPTFGASPDTTYSASVTFGTVSAVGRFYVGDLANPILVSGGAALIKHGGRAYRDLDNTSSMGVALGLGTQFRLASRIGLDVGFKGFIYSIGLRDSAGNLPSSTQVDLLGSAGLTFFLGRPPEE